MGFTKKKVLPGEPEVPKWQGAVANKEKLTVEDAKFLFDQAEKFLKDSVENSNLIVTRTSSVITLLAGTLVAFIGFAISKFSFNALTITAVIGTIYIYILIYNAFENTKPQVYLIPGALPKDLFADEFFVEGITNEKRIIHFYISETENYQFKIEKNKVEAVCRPIKSYSSNATYTSRSLCYYLDFITLSKSSLLDISI